MSDSKDLEHTDAFYTQLFSKAWKTIAVIIVVGIIVFGLMAYTIFAHRRSRHPKPADFHEST